MACGVCRSLSCWQSYWAWYSRAAAQQQTEALFRLGHFYRIGQGVTKNPARAVLLLYAAAMNGDTNAMVLLPALGGIILLLAR